MTAPNDDHGDEADPVPSPDEKPMGFWEHLEELRGTLVKSATVFVLFAAVIGYYLSEFDRVLMWPFHTAAMEFPKLIIELGTSSPMEGVNIVVQICLFGGLMLSAPFILFFVGQFVAPALTRKEKRAVLPMCVAASALFLGGAAFGFFLLVPSAVRMMIALNQSQGWVMRWSVESYYSMLLRLVVGVGATFQFPLILVLFVWLGILSTAFLRRYRRHAIVAIFVLAAVVTPSTDPIQQTVLAVPLIVLYELAIVVAGRVEKRRERSGQAVLLALLALLPRRRTVPTWGEANLRL